MTTPHQTSQIEDAVEVYRLLSKVPQLERAFVSKAADTENNAPTTVLSTWTQRDLEKGESVKFQRTHLVQVSSKTLLPIQLPPVALSSIIWNTESPSGKYCAIIKSIKDTKGEEKQYIEVWNNTGMVHSINVTSLDKHGKIYEAGTFGSCEWSYDEKSLLYIAEKKLPKLKSFFEKTSEKEKDETIVRGEQHLYREQWGEQNTGHSTPVLCVLDIFVGEVSVVDCLPDHISPGQAVWCPGEEIICVGWWHDPYRLGIIYCPTRRSALFHIDLKNSKCAIIGCEDQAVRSPRFSPDQSKLVYLQNPAGGPHWQCSQLNMINWSNKEVETVVDIIFSPKENDFPGLFALNLPKQCWSADNKRVIFSTQWRSKNEIVIADTASGVVTKVTNAEDIGCWTVQDVYQDIIVASCSSFSQPPYLVMGWLGETSSSVSWVRIDQGPEPLRDVVWKVMPMEVPPEASHPKYGAIPYEFILVEPAKKYEKPPLINLMHGGPHTAFSVEYRMDVALLCRLGYAILLVNYRGSVGFGQDCIDSLPGNCGTMDVQDIHRVVERVVSLGIVDPDRMVVTGGSHGGFLTAHMIGQYPDLYKAAACRNPATDMGILSGITDIVDWCFVEAGCTFDYTTLCDAKALEKMWNCSPMQYVDKMKTPILIMLGAKDLRVPTHQGHELRKALQARGAIVKTHCYPEDCHPLSKVETEADVLINMVQWFTEHLPAKK